MNDYYEIYRARAQHYGVTPQDRAFKIGKLDFKRYLRYSPNSTAFILDKSNEKLFGVILTKKQNENEVNVSLSVELDTPLQVGDLISWKNSKWIIYEKVQKSFQPYDTYYITKADYLCKWVDSSGAKHESWAHVIGSMDSQIKNNFRTWNNTITPQPNKYIEIIMPYQKIEKETEIILFEEAWSLTEYDKTSVPGIIYLSFTETRVNDLRDDVDESLANADKINTWTIQAPSTIFCVVGEPFELNYSIAKDGIIQPDITPTIALGPGLSYTEDGKIINNDINDSKIVYTYENGIFIQEIVVGEKKVNGYISGPDYIRTTKKDTFTFVLGDTVFDQNINFSINNQNLATIDSIENNVCVVAANQDNKNGQVKLIVSYDDKTYEKVIRILSLWQEA